MRPLAILRSGHTVDVVFTDVQMPGEMDGFGLARWVRANLPGVEVIITSGIAPMARKAGDLCAESECADIEKPHDHQMVERHIRMMLAAKDRSERSMR